MKKTLSLEGMWVEKYRPRCLDDMALDKEIKELIIDYAKKEEIPNLLFVGRPGIVKTTLARIICDDILKCQHLYINASDENGIDTVRTKVMSFAQTKSIDGGIKVIILDEVGGTTPDFQKALRNVMESYARYTRFILTANELHKVTPAIQSRCDSIHVECSLLQVVSRCADILKREGITVGPDQKNPLIQLIKSRYPDVRKAVMTLQRMCASGTLVIKQVDDISVAEDLLKLILAGKSCTDVRQFVIENEDEFSSDYPALLRTLLQVIYKEDLLEKNKQMLICVVAEHLYRSAFVMDQEINAFHCFINMLSNT